MSSEFKNPITIADAIYKIEHSKYLLPAIQREFIWENPKIEWLFDSIMRNYPIASFLFWKVRVKPRVCINFTNSCSITGSGSEHIMRNLMTLPLLQILKRCLMVNNV